jgi:hypothetical protein
MDGFKVIKKSDLPTAKRFNGKAAGLASVSYQKNGNLLFSKAAAGIFGDDGNTCKIEYHEKSRTMLFTATAQPPLNCTDVDLFKLNVHHYTDKAGVQSISNAAVAMKSCFEWMKVNIIAPCKIEIKRMDPQARCIWVVLPEEGAGQYDPKRVIVCDAEAVVDVRELPANSPD